MNQEAKRPLIPLTPLKAAAKRRWESEGIEITRPLCGIQRDGNRKSQGARARLCKFPGRIPLRRVWAAAQRNPRPPNREANKKARIRERSVPDSTKAALNRREAEKGV